MSLNFTTPNYAVALEPIEPSVALAKPLIVGASVSAGFKAQSPGKNLALRYTTEDHVKTVAFNGKPAKEVLQQVNARTLENRSAVIGLDLFFWDSVHPQPKESIEALHLLVNRAARKNIPLILGDVPELLAGFQPGRPALNAALRETCKHFKNCRIVPLDQLLRKVLADGFLSYHGKRYVLEDLVPDGLHLSPIASDYLADETLKALRSVFVG